MVAESLPASYHPLFQPKKADEKPHPHSINTLQPCYSAIFFSTRAEREVL